MPKTVLVPVLVKVPDGVDVEDYLNDVSFDANHPTDGDIYHQIDDSGYQVVGEG